MRITPRERQVLYLASNGLNTREIARQTYLSPYTVNDHLKKLKTKMDASNIAQLIRRGFESGILSINSTNRS